LLKEKQRSKAKMTVIGKQEKRTVVPKTAMSSAPQLTKRIEGV